MFHLQLLFHIIVLHVLREPADNDDDDNNATWNERI